MSSIEALQTEVGDITYTLCTTAEAVLEAVTILSASEYVVIDCEGKNLGKGDGVLSLLSIGTAQAKQIFVFDAVTLKKDDGSMDALLGFLSTEDVMKVVWDGRMDSLEILVTYGVTLRGVLDLQIAEVVSRSSARGEGERKRLQRLVDTFFSAQAINSYPSQYTGLQVVVGMQKCLEELKLEKYAGKDPEVTAMHKSNQSHLWLQRPLSAKLLHYAAQDIFIIALLYENFIKKGWILPAQIPSLCNQSARYISIYKTRAQADADNLLRALILVPLDVLTEPSGRQYLCTLCARDMSLSCFETKVKGMMHQRRQKCRNCYVVAIKRRLGPDNTWVRL